MDSHGDIIAGHGHFDAVGEGDRAGDVGSTDVELGTIAGEEGSMPAALIAAEDIDLGFEEGVRGDGLRSGEDLAALDIISFDAAQEAADVIAGLAGVQDFTEHFDAGNDGGLGIALDADDFDDLAGIDLAAFDTAGDDGTAALDVEDIFDRHQEGLVHSAGRSRDIVVYGFHEFEDGGEGWVFGIVAAAFERLEGAAADDRDIVAWESRT